MYTKEYEDLFNKGVITLNQKHAPKEALEYFKKAYRLVDNDPELFNSMGGAYLLLGEYDKAISFLNRALSLDQYNPISLVNLAILYAIKGRYDEAIEAIETALSHNPDFQQAKPILMQLKRMKENFGSLRLEEKKVPKKALKLFQQGIMLINQQKLEEAVELIRAAILKYPKFAEAYLYLGIIREASHNHQKALKCFNKALELDPDLPLAWVHKGVIYDSQEMFEKAIECYDKAIDLDANNSSSYNNKGLALASLEKYEEAIECYNKSIELNPDYEGVYNNRAIIYKKTNQYERAIADFKKLLELNPRDDYAKKQIDDLKVFSRMGVEGNFRTVVDARDYCPRCGKKNYTNSELCPYCRTPMHQDNVQKMLETAIDDEYSGNFENALMTLVRINEREPTHPEAWFFRGKAHCALAEFKNALMCFGKCQNLGISFTKLMQWGIRAQNNLKSFAHPNLSEENLAAVEVKIPPLASEDEITWNASGAALQMLMQYEKAYKCYQNALKINPDYNVAKKNMEFIENLAKST